MFTLRNVLQSALRLSNYSTVSKNLISSHKDKFLLPNVSKFFSVSSSKLAFRNVQNPLIKTNTSLLSSISQLLHPLSVTTPSLHQTRSVTKWSLNKGKRKTVKAVVARFYRLGWGAWIRPMVGRNKRHWSKTAKRKIRAEKHVFCNSTQSTLLDKMVTKYWRKRRFFI
uniref:Large ribosomal subunit protein bL35m n=1 Tax=Daphnia galeata TaxID=27404 RepID=A0A8J2RAS9_9CRUS|nr:unnamed protein product [Daphnia galeata]